MATNTTRLSSRGQVVIPAWIRRQLNLSTGDRLRVEVGPPGDQTIVLRRHSRAEIERLLQKGYEWLERSGYDPVEALHATRRRERAREARPRRP